jgi:hypothetical protein
MPQYTFKNRTDGKVDILENGASIAPNGSGFEVNYAKTLGYKPEPVATASAQTTPIQSPVPMSSLSSAQTPQLPEPQAPAIQQQHVASVAEETKNARAALEADYDKRKTEADAKLEALKAEEQGYLDKAEELSQPFRESLENAERERLHINENFEANQRLVSELESLTAEANSRLTGELNRFAPKDTIAAGYNRTLSDIIARRDLIQSIMSARNGQINKAYTLIDRSVAAISADRQDNLNYYDALLNLNKSGQLKLDEESKSIAEEKTALLKGDLDRLTETADTIKQAMLDPDTAQAYADAGVSLLDSPAEINEKLAQYGYAKEVRDLANEMAASGYGTVVPGVAVPYGSQVVTVKDSKGVERQYYSKPPATGSGTGNSNTIIDNERALLGQFQASPIVKDYNTIVSQKLAMDNIISNGVGGPADLSLVFSFMKGLDPNSVVRESEYDTAAKSGNIFAGAFARFNGYLKEGGGFLPENVRTQFQNLVNQKLHAQQIAYDNYAEYYRGIARRQGLNPDNVVPNFSGALEISQEQIEAAATAQLDAELEDHDEAQQHDGFFDSFLSIFGLKTK